ncbi:MAG: hypothetical protein HPY57_15635 [Ignavibacteria bacterium]|nr:hypothetical protein [Ignavibacteria bacterium]
MFKKLLSLMKNSVIVKNGKSSSTRIISYSISAIILLFCLVFIGIEISAAIIALNTVGKYVISNEIIIIFGSLLAQQLTLLGITKSNETSQLKLEKKEKPDDKAKF